MSRTYVLLFLFLVVNIFNYNYGMRKIYITNYLKSKTVKKKNKYGVEEKVNLMPSFADFRVYAITKKYSIKPEELGEYKGLVDIYQEAWLNNKVSLGARNSMSLVPMLKQFEGASAVSTQAPVNIIMPKRTISKKGVQSEREIKLISKEH